MYSPTEGRSSSCQRCRASCAAPRMALPAIKVMREAETEPELRGLVAVSAAIRRTRSSGVPSASAAIWQTTVWDPWPTSAVLI